jgi:hypothetical protein
MSKEENTAQAEMPRYRCHKEVWALKIKEIKRVEPPRFEGLVCRGCSTLGTACGGCERCKWENENKDRQFLIVPADAGYAQFPVSREYMVKHNPQVGGYYVVYKGGYASYSPADAFEDGYSLI